MASPEVDRLIQELSQILNRNREQRSTSEALMQGIQQGAEMAQQRRAASEQAAGAEANRESRGAGLAEQYARAASGDKRTLEHRSTSEALAPALRSMSRGESGPAGDAVRLEDNAAPYEFLKDNDTPAPAMSPADSAVLDERKKRFMQNLALRDGRTGPLGGAGTPPVDAAALQAAGNPQFPASPQYPSPQQPNIPALDQAAGMGPGQPPAGWSAEDYAILSQAAQGYPR